MNFDDIIVKESPGLCRCCLSEGCYKDLGTEYSWMNETEVYADMLLDCFDIGITQHNDGPNGPKRLICEVCITRLRDACNFKKQVLDSEKKFIDMLGRGQFLPKAVLLYQPSEVKAETSDSQTEAAGVEYLDEVQFEDEEIVRSEDIPVEPTTSEPQPQKLKRGRPKKVRDEDESPLKKTKVVKKAKPVKGGKRENQPSVALTPTKLNKLMKKHATIILESSTMVPFKWQRQHYLCFFCHSPFDTINEVKSHMASHKMSKVSSAVSLSNPRIKVDISDLSCKICWERIDGLTSFVEHLKTKHDRKLNSANGLVPYIFGSDYKCGVCGETFGYFINLNQHMNKHFGDYVCELCGKSFLSSERLRSHALSHGAKFRCNHCSDSFPSLIKRNAHQATVHSIVKSYKCQYCPEIFTTYLTRRSHHNSAHDIKIPSFSCPDCDKNFQVKSKMLVHLRAVHLRERTVKCTMCDKMFFSNHMLKRHMKVHNDLYKCDVCDDLFERKQDLRCHFRKHGNDTSTSMDSFRNTKKYVKPRKYKGCESSSTRRRRNLLIIFNNTSIIPFKWRGKYLCFYCSKDISEYNELRKHTKSHGNCSTLDHSLKALKGGKNMEIKIDVSDIICEKCGLLFASYEAIVNHLEDTHTLVYDRTVEMAIEKYRLSDLKCMLCDQKFTYFGYLVSHVNSCHPKNCLICDKCHQKFNKKRDLFSHIKTYHREGGYQCDICPQLFSSLNILRKHKINRHTTRCHICQLRLPSAALRQKHIDLEHPDDGSLQCDICNKVFHTKQGLRMHARKCNASVLELTLKKEDYSMDLDLNYQDPGNKPSVKQIRQNIVTVINMSTVIPFNFYKNKFNCFYCSKDFADSDSMREHTVLEHPVCDIKEKCIKKCRESVACVKIDVSSLSCKVCFDSMIDLESLLDHLITKHDADYDKSITTCLQPYRLVKDRMSCPNCPEIFRFFGTLLKHMNKKHTNNNIICVYCGETFRRDQNLRVHIWRHHRAGRFKCSICDADCLIPSRLYMHMAKVHDVKAAKCPKCPETFATQYLRQKHLIDAHNSGHKCSYCGKLFTRNSFMRDHIRRTHLKEKNVECSVCSMKFFNNILLRRHMVKHSGEKNFHCEVCGERFFWRKSLRTHMARHNKHLEALRL